ncbi:reverse transcriptase domain-containing protein, partial [Tanacetum coccineum]
MSDLEDSAITYTTVSSPYGGLSDIGSPGMDGLPVMPEDPYAYVVAAFQASPSPEYVPGPEEPQAPLPLDFVSEPVYPEFMPAEDEVFSTKEQPLPVAASPTDQSPGYIPKSDPEEDPEEDDEDPEEDPADYPADRDDDDEEEEEEPSRDDVDDEDEDEDEDEEEEEEHPASTDFVPPVHRMTAMISIQDEPFISLPPREEIPSPPLPVPPPVPILPLPLPTSPTYLLGYRAVSIRLRPEALCTSHVPPSGTPPLLPIPAPILSPPVLLPSTDHRADRPEVCLPPRKRLCLTLGPSYEIGERSSVAAARPTRGRRADYRFVDTMDAEIRRRRAKEVGYGIRDVWVDPREAAEEVAPMTLEGVNTRVTELAAVQEKDTQDIYAMIEDTQDRQTQIYQRVKTLVDDRQYHYETIRLLDQEALVSQEAWGRSIEVSYMARSEIMALRSIGMNQQAKMAALQTADHARQEDSRDPLEVQHSQLHRRRPAMIDQGVTAILAARDATRNGDDSHTSGTGVRRTERVARECTYQDFIKYQPLYFKGTEGVVELTQWFERMETVFSISNYSVDNQIKFSTCTLLAGALTWWNSHVRIVGQDVAYAITWTDLRKKMTDKYCPRNEMKKLEVELWNFKVKGTGVTGYNQRFQELALLCVRMFLEETGKVERYVGGLPDMIQQSVV